MISPLADNVRNKMNPSVSICMPVYNGEAFIEQALASLLAQSHTDFELIISDNASIDGTAEILRRYQKIDRRIRVDWQSKNLGVIANFKYLLDQAGGDYFMWAAADDIWDRNWISTLLVIAKAHKCLAMGRVKMIDELGREKKHVSSHRAIGFTGPSVWRRLKYFSAPSLHGKQNAYYGLYNRCLMKPESLDNLSGAAQAMDLFFIYEHLKSAEIRDGGAVYMSKRAHPGSDGAKAGAVLGSGRLVDSVFRRSLLHKYLEYSGGTEKLLLILAWPVCAFRIKFAKLGYLAQRLQWK